MFSLIFFLSVVVLLHVNIWIDHFLEPVVKYENKDAYMARLESPWGWGGQHIMFGDKWETSKKQKSGAFISEAPGGQ